MARRAGSVDSVGLGRAVLTPGGHNTRCTQGTQYARPTQSTRSTQVDPPAPATRRSWAGAPVIRPRHLGQSTDRALWPREGVSKGQAGANPELEAELRGRVRGRE